MMFGKSMMILALVAMASADDTVTLRVEDGFAGTNLLKQKVGDSSEGRSQEELVSFKKGPHQKDLDNLDTNVEIDLLEQKTEAAMRKLMAELSEGQPPEHVEEMQRMLMESFKDNDSLFEGMKELAKVPKEKQGEKAVEILKKMGADEEITAMVEKLPEVMKNMKDALPEMMENMKDALPEMMENMEATLPEVVEKLNEALPELKEAFPGIEKALPEIEKALKNPDELKKNLGQFMKQVEAAMGKAAKNMPQTGAAKVTTVTEEQV